MIVVYNIAESERDPDRREKEMATNISDVVIISKQTVRPSPPPTGEEESRRTTIHLTPWDLMKLSINYIQKGLLFSDNNTSHQVDNIISTLLSSFNKALTHFYPFAGRLSTLHHATTTPPSLSISLLCNDAGADFIHAAAPSVSIADLVSSGHHMPPVFNSFFPLNGAIGHDGHSLPVLAVQVTELSDGFFLGLSFNHVVADGFSFWHFINTWSDISRSGADHLRQPIHLDRWFLPSTPPPILLPYTSTEEFIKKPKHPSYLHQECFFNFPARSIRELKRKANEEMGTGNRISSLQALLAHVWLAVTRARRLGPEEETMYKVLVGNRRRMSPPLPQGYLGNSVSNAIAKATAGELREAGLGWAAWQLNQAVAAIDEETVRGMLAEWPGKPAITYFIPTVGAVRGVMTGGSPRFDMFGNDFGWGRPVAARSGAGNKMDGKATVYEGAVDGSIGMEMYLSAAAMELLLEDEEFMDMVGVA